MIPSLRSHGLDERQRPIGQLERRSRVAHPVECCSLPVKCGRLSRRIVEGAPNVGGLSKHVECLLWLAAVEKGPGLHRERVGLAVAVWILAVDLERLRRGRDGLFPASQSIEGSRLSYQRERFTSSIDHHPSKFQCLVEGGQCIDGLFEQEIGPSQTEQIAGRAASIFRKAA